MKSSTKNAVVGVSLVAVGIGAYAILGRQGQEEQFIGGSGNASDVPELNPFGTNETPTQFFFFFQPSVSSGETFLGQPTNSSTSAIPKKESLSFYDFGGTSAIKNIPYTDSPSPTISGLTNILTPRSSSSSPSFYDFSRGKTPTEVGVSNLVSQVAPPKSSGGSSSSSTPQPKKRKKITPRKSKKGNNSVYSKRGYL